MGRVIAVANQKGGVGKTTTAVNLGACLALDEHRTLLVDLDPQANATSGCGAAAESLHGSTYEVLIGQADLPRVLHSVDQIPLLSLAPAHIRLAGIEVEMAAVMGRERKLAEALEPVTALYDFVLIDCPPSLGTLTINALTAADSVLIPVQCEYYALEGLSKLFSTVRLVQRYLNPALQIEGVLLTMYDERLHLSRRVAAEVRDYFGGKVYQTCIRRNVKLAEAPSHGQPIVSYDPVSTGAENYSSLALEVGSAMHSQREATPAL
jgi:chromosome partitioning protein